MFDDSATEVNHTLSNPNCTKFLKDFSVIELRLKEKRFKRAARDLQHHLNKINNHSVKRHTCLEAVARYCGEISYDSMHRKYFRDIKKVNPELPNKVLEMILCTYPGEERQVERILSEYYDKAFKDGLTRSDYAVATKDPNLHHTFTWGLSLTRIKDTGQALVQESRALEGYLHMAISDFFRELGQYTADTLRFEKYYGEPLKAEDLKFPNFKEYLKIWLDKSWAAPEKGSSSRSNLAQYTSVVIN